MLNSDPVTFESLKLLWGLAATQDHRPILVWVGAGASSWLGYERWAEVANRFHSTFVRKSSASYTAREASESLSKEDYPKLFQMCFDASPELYRSMLATSFSPKPIKPVYRRFVEAINRVGHISVVTTNVDEMLEHTLPEFQLLQRSDLSRVTELVGSGHRFVAKFHGSISSVETTVFKTDDYRSLELDSTFLDCLKYLTASCSIVFVGYGVRDQYVFELLQRNAATHSLFGAGPHFLISTNARPELPKSVHLIQYQTDFHADHRSSILSIELLARPSTEVASFEYGPASRSSESELTSAHLLSDFYPAGAWGTGQTAMTKGNDGATAEIITGPGWVHGETPVTPTAVHDLIVGLMCFDRVLVPLECISRVFGLLGETHFRRLVLEGVVQFVHWEGFDLVMCFSSHPGFGGLATGKKGKGELPGEMIRRQMHPAPGREHEGAELISRLEETAISVDLSGTKNFADVCNGLFSSPATRKILGMSEGTPVGNIPRWLAHPALRLIHIARIGATCQRLSLGSMKLMTGAAKLAEIAFSAVAGGVLASEVANYAIAGEFGIVDQRAFLTEPRLWDVVIKFRETSSGVDFRREVFKRLRKNDAAEIVPAIDSNLKELLPTKVMHAARTEFSTLLTATGIRRVVPAIWNDLVLLQDGPAAWRKVSRQRLKEFLRRNQIGPYDDCPCGSYDRVKFCCLPALEA
jgi:hypothetical protein